MSNNITFKMKVDVLTVEELEGLKKYLEKIVNLNEMVIIAERTPNELKVYTAKYPKTDFSNNILGG